MKPHSYEPIQKTGKRFINLNFALPYYPFLPFLPLSFAIVKQEVTLVKIATKEKSTLVTFQ